MDDKRQEICIFIIYEDVYLFLNRDNNEYTLIYIDSTLVLINEYTLIYIDSTLVLINEYTLIYIDSTLVLINEDLLYTHRQYSSIDQ